MGSYGLLSAVLAARRGEVVALQWEDIDLDGGVIGLDENFVWTAEGMLLKGIKSHQMRRVSIGCRRSSCCASSARIARLNWHCSTSSWGSHMAISAKPIMSWPRDPESLTRRYGRLVAKLGIGIVLKELRHYSATELLTARVDLRTLPVGSDAVTASRRSGTTRRRSDPDQTAAGVIGGRMSSLRPRG